MSETKPLCDLRQFDKEMLDKFQIHIQKHQNQTPEPLPPFSKNLVARRIDYRANIPEDLQKILFTDDFVSGEKL